MLEPWLERRDVRRHNRAPTGVAMDHSDKTISSSLIGFGREICGDLSAAESREWLVTNGLGGFASGTVGGQLTRRYHGLLIAALHPPLGRTLLVPKFDEVVEYDGRPYPMATNRWRSGVIEPQGYRRIEEFRLEGMSPVWTYACGDALVSKTVWMEYGANTTYVRYRLERASRSVRLPIKALVNEKFLALCRDFGPENVGMMTGDASVNPRAPAAYSKAR